MLPSGNESNNNSIRANASTLGKPFGSLNTLEQSIFILERILFDGVQEERELARLFEDDVGKAKGIFFFLKEIGWMKEDSLVGRGDGGSSTTTNYNNSGSISNVRDDTGGGTIFQVTEKGRAAVRMYSGVDRKGRL